MLSYIHQTIGFLVVVSNLIAAIWLWLLDSWGRPLERGPRLTLLLARATLLLQILLGIGLISGGAVGRTGHYLFAMVAVVGGWFSYTTSQRPDANKLRVQAIGCAVVGVCALAAYLLGRG